MHNIMYDSKNILCILNISLLLLPPKPQFILYKSQISSFFFFFLEINLKCIMVHKAHSDLLQHFHQNWHLWVAEVSVDYWINDGKTLQ